MSRLLGRPYTFGQSERLDAIRGHCEEIDMREFNSYAGSKPDIFVGGPGGVFDSGDYVGHLDNLVNRQGWMEEFSDT